MGDRRHLLLNPDFCVLMSEQLRLLFADAEAVEDAPP